MKLSESIQSTVTMTKYILYFQLATSCNSSNLIELFDWYIYPIVNPDGYEFALTTVCIKELGGWNSETLEILKMS